MHTAKINETYIFVKKNMPKPTVTTGLMLNYKAPLHTTKYFSVLQSTTPGLLCTTKHYSSTTKYYSVQQSTGPVLQSTTLYYTVLLQYYKVLLRYYNVLQSTTPELQSTTPVLSKSHFRHASNQQTGGNIMLNPYKYRNLQKKEAVEYRERNANN